MVIQPVLWFGVDHIKNLNLEAIWKSSYELYVNEEANFFLEMVQYIVWKG